MVLLLIVCDALFEPVIIPIAAQTFGCTCIDDEVVVRSHTMLFEIVAAVVAALGMYIPLTLALMLVLPLLKFAIVFPEIFNAVLPIIFAFTPFNMAKNEDDDAWMLLGVVVLPIKLFVI